MKYCPLCAHELESIEIDGKPRLSCRSKKCEYVYWNNPTPVIAALVERDDKVVLVRHKTWPKKMFGLVTGFLEEGEAPESGILREVKEELGVEGKLVDFIGYYAFFEMNQLILAFHVQVNGEFVLNEELAEVKIIPPERLRPWAFGTGYAVSDWLKKRTSS
ncbi:MAG: NUDIX domain-containing protein [Desulfobacterales bacterium]|nr:MAG: NUDIX domain-containing protein [Desulfobacterales bacterium]